MNIALWVIQVLLALLYLMAGGTKLVMPPEAMTPPPGGMSLPVAFLRFIGVMEILGAIGLILPGLLRIRTELTPLAASGLVIIMIGAVAVSIGAGLNYALLPALAGLLALTVAYARWRVVPLSASPRSTTSRVST